MILVPVLGALVVGLMARYGSERIRGHGIPEAIEAILVKGGRVEPKVAFLKLANWRFAEEEFVAAAQTGETTRA